MRKRKPSFRKWLLLLAMALAGCEYTERLRYPCAVVQQRNSGWLEYCYGDSVNMLTSHHAIVYRNGTAMAVKDNENRLQVECGPYKLPKP